jgi:hypothetical protein
MEPIKNKKPLNFLVQGLSNNFLLKNYEYTRTSLNLLERLDELDDVLIIVFILLYIIFYFFVYTKVQTFFNLT